MIRRAIVVLLAYSHAYQNPMIDSNGLKLSKREKRLQKIRQNPKNVSMDALEQVLKDYGIDRDHATGGHYIFRYNLNGQYLRLTIPYRKPIKAIYVKEAIAVIDRIRAVQKEVEGNE
jgi:hypothetical protein